MSRDTHADRQSTSKELIQSLQIFATLLTLARRRLDHNVKLSAETWVGRPCLLPATALPTASEAHAARFLQAPLRAL